MLDKANEILDKKLEKSTQEDEMEWEKNDLFHVYNLAEVMAAEEAKVAKPTLK